MVVANSRWMGASYSAWVRDDKGLPPRRVVDFVRRRSWYLVRRMPSWALGLDEESATTQMIEEGWWG